MLWMRTFSLKAALEIPYRPKNTITSNLVRYPLQYKGNRRQYPEPEQIHF
jgi:hypothetical protein